ncbi:MAG: hypothetical protein KF727_06190 [Microbacteriaceae bacterium]|nr:hypothetical protein [Microbacteriaceae bacterium]
MSEVTPDGPPQPAFPTVVAPRPVTWHSRAVLIGMAGFALVAAILTLVGGAGFPYNAPVEQIYCIGLAVDLAAVVITLGVLTAQELTRRRSPERRAAPVNGAPSVLALVGIALSAATLVAWAALGGVEQLGFLLTGIRGRYMYHTGGIFIAGIPWALGMIFGAWGFRPGGGHRVTNVLALVSIGIGVFLAVVSVIAALVYGADLSD